MSEESEEAENVKPKTEGDDGKGDDDFKPELKDRQRYRAEDFDNSKCNMRIEELAKPKRLKVKLNYMDYKKLLPERNVKVVLAFLREEFAKTPEDTQIDFKKIEHDSNVKKCKRICKQEARKVHLMKMTENKRKNMLKTLKDILRKYISRAYFNPKQIIMTTRLRRISNTVLTELCKIRKIPVPKRESTKIRALLMFATADFFAYCIDMLYYELQVKKVTDYEQLQKLRAIEPPPEQT